MADKSMLDRAIELAAQATSLDGAGKYAEAYDLYIKAINHFMHVIKFEKNPKLKEMVHAKTLEYMGRCEKLKEFLQKKTPVREGGGGGSGTKKSGGSAPGASSGGKDDEEEDEEKKKRKDALGDAILREKPDVHWEDVAGLEAAKEALKEAVILPIKFPSLFEGKRKPWRGILLYGPPGTGKSFLAKAVATEANNSTFFSISSSALLSKWLGESEKLVKTLFDMARAEKPSIVFIDEIDSLTSERSDQESESSRRVKTEFLVQMNGVGQDMDGVLVLAATNIPWALDPAIRRRFEKRIYIGLPEAPARTNMFRIHLGSTANTITAEQFKQLGEMTDGFSGSDISTLVRDAIMQPVRRVQCATHFAVDSQGRYSPCSPGEPNAIEMSWDKVPGDKLGEMNVTFNDFLKSLKNTKATVGKADIERQKKWTAEFGMEG